MTTAREKADAWIRRSVSIYSDSMIDSLEKLLKEQDRDTRHACAEAVLQCNEDNEDVSGECILKDDAHAACINAIGV